MFDSLNNKQIVLGVTGSIAAYKAAELVRLLRTAGCSVRVVMTQGAREFITPLTLQALSDQRVHIDLLDSEAEASMGHIELARWGDMILVAPASADFLSRLAQGRATDLLNAVCLASETPMVVAPAMNQVMWIDSATQENMRLIQQRGILCFGPAEGKQACGEIGAGRLLEPSQIVQQLSELFDTGSLAGKTVLVTAGPTREALDPVRFLSNQSSGKMGYAVATAAVEAGARVKLISGPVSLSTPQRLQRINIITAKDMLTAVQKEIHGADIFISAAAVADYRPLQVSDKKMKKNSQNISLQLERTPDILATIKQQYPALFCVGFAAETHQLADNAQQKLYNKGVDMIAANWVGSVADATQTGFDSDLNALHVYWQDGDVELTLTNKGKLARQLIALIAERYNLYPEMAELACSKVVNIKNVPKK